MSLPLLLCSTLCVGEGPDLVRELAQWALQQLIEAEATEKIGAEPWERSGERATCRNGTRPRVLSTKAGDLQLAIPKLCKGSFFPGLVEPRRRIDQALYAPVRLTDPGRRLPVGGVDGAETPALRGPQLGGRAPTAVGEHEGDGRPRAPAPRPPQDPGPAQQMIGIWVAG